MQGEWEALEMSVEWAENTLLRVYDKWGRWDPEKTLSQHFEALTEKSDEMSAIGHMSFDDMIQASQDFGTKLWLAGDFLPPTHEHLLLAQYADFEYRRGKYALDRWDVGVVIGCFGRGTPEEEEWDIFQPALELLQEYPGRVLVGVQEYPWCWPWFWMGLNQGGDINCDPPHPS